MTNQYQFVPATPGQLVEIGFKIAGTVTRILSESGKISFKTGNHLILSPEHEVEKITKNFCKDFFGIVIDPWAEEKRRIEVFYKKFFDLIIDWSLISVPIKGIMNRLDVAFGTITEDQYFEAYAKKFGKDNVWKYYNSITNAIHEQQIRPAGNYAYCHIGGDEPDFLNKSYDDGINENIKFMVPKEGIVSAFRYRTEANKMYDVKGITLFAALDSDGYAMSMYRDYYGQFFVGYDDRDHCYPDNGLRKVDF